MTTFVLGSVLVTGARPGLLFPIQAKPTHRLGKVRSVSGRRPCATGAALPLQIYDEAVLAALLDPKNLPRQLSTCPDRSLVMMKYV